MSLMTMIFTAAPVIAPSIGAVLVAQWNWRAPFIAIAACGFALLFGIRSNLVETHTPNTSQHPLRQLASSFREYFSHRQSLFGLLLLALTPAGSMSVIAVSAALTVEIYGLSITQYGLDFRLCGPFNSRRCYCEPMARHPLRDNVANQARSNVNFHCKRSVGGRGMARCCAVLVGVVLCLYLHVHDRDFNAERHCARA